MTERLTSSPSIGDKIIKSRLPRRVKETIIKEGIETFKKLRSFSKRKLFFALMRSGVKPKELIILNAELVGRKITPVSIPQGFELGVERLPLTVIERLWRNEIYTYMDLIRQGQSKIREIVGRRHIAKIERHVREHEGTDLTFNLYWLAAGQLPEEALDELRKRGINTVGDLPTSSDHFQGKAVGRKTATYVTWWFDKKHPKILKSCLRKIRATRRARQREEQRVEEEEDFRPIFNIKWGTG